MLIFTLKSHSLILSDDYPPPPKNQQVTSKNKLYVGDNLDVMHGMNSASVDLIYLDPPFNSKRIYAAPIGSPAEKKASAKGALKQAGFSDIWVWNEDVDIRLESFLTNHPYLFAYIDLAGNVHGSPMKAYLTFMAQRIIEMHRILKETGSLYLHCDPTASHYLKIILDYIFGKHNFRNEIIWCYRTGGASKRHFSKKSDTIFFYSKSSDYIFNVPKAKSYVEMSAKEIEKNYTSKAINTGKDELGNYWEYMSAQDKMKIYKDEFGYFTSVNARNWWVDIPAIGRYNKERTGYPTQKPLALLNRIIKASSNEGDLVLDSFCGCATTCVAAHHLQRNWIGIDVSDVAVDLVRDRLTEETAQKLITADHVKSKVFSDFIAIKTMPVRTDLEKLTLGKPQIRKHFYGEQNGNCNGCQTHFDHSRHFHIDHIYPESKGGAWVLENLQLLCGNCNSIKGDRPMEYLNTTLKTRKAQNQFY